MHNIQYPYDYTKAEVDALLKPATQTELQTFFHGKKITAINMYCGRTKVKDRDLVAWMFWTVSRDAHDQKRLEEAGSKLTDKLDEYAKLPPPGELSPEDLEKEKELYKELEETLLNSLKEHNINLPSMKLPPLPPLTPPVVPEETKEPEIPSNKFKLPWSKKPKPPIKD